MLPAHAYINTHTHTLDTAANRELKVSTWEECIQLTTASGDAVPAAPSEQDIEQLLLIPEMVRGLDNPYSNVYATSAPTPPPANMHVAPAPHLTSASALGLPAGDVPAPSTGSAPLAHWQQTAPISPYLSSSPPSASTQPSSRAPASLTRELSDPAEAVPEVVPEAVPEVVPEVVHAEPDAGTVYIAQIVAFYKRTDGRADKVPLHTGLVALEKDIPEVKRLMARASGENGYVLPGSVALLYRLCHAVVNAVTETHHKAPFLQGLRALTYGYSMPNCPPFRIYINRWPSAFAYYNHISAWSVHQYPNWALKLLDHIAAMPTAPLGGDVHESLSMASALIHERPSGTRTFDSRNEVWEKWFDQLVRHCAHGKKRPPIKFHDLCAAEETLQMVPPFHTFHPSQKPSIVDKKTLFMNPVRASRGTKCARCNRTMLESPTTEPLRHMGYFYAYKHCRCTTLRHCMRCTLEDWLYRVLAIRDCGAAAAIASGGSVASLATYSRAGAAAGSEQAASGGTKQTLYAVKCPSCDDSLWSPVTLQPVYHTYKIWFSESTTKSHCDRICKLWLSSYKSTGRRGCVNYASKTVCKHTQSYADFPHIGVDEIIPVDSPLFPNTEQLGVLCKPEELYSTRSLAAAPNQRGASASGDSSSSSSSSGNTPTSEERRAVSLGSQSIYNVHAQAHNPHM